MATLTTKVVPNTGLSPTYDPAAAAGDKCATGSGVVLHVKNAHTAAQDVVLVTPQTVDGLAVADRTISIPATSGSVFIPVPDLYRNPSDGLCSLTYPLGVTALTVAVLRVA